MDPAGPGALISVKGSLVRHPAVMGAGAAALVALGGANVVAFMRGMDAPWLLGIARNFVRRRTGTRETAEVDDADLSPPADAPTPEAALIARVEIDALRRAIAALPPHYRDVLVLVELAERSYAEAAAICGCELNTVRSRLFRARALVAQALRASPGNARIAQG